jgi:PAS domain S-box-containing protein
MAFTLYQDVYGFFNLLGHNFKIVSFYLIYAALIKTNLKKPYESLVHEIDERKQAQEEKIFKLSRIYAVISQINQTIVRTREKDTILSEACRIAVEYGKFRMAWIGMIDEETKLVKPVAFSGVEEGYLSKIKGISVDDVPEGRGLTGTAIREGRHYVCGDIEKDPRMALWREEALKRGYRSSMALPIRQFDKVIGAFSLYASVPDFFDPEEIYLLDEVTNDISFAMNSIETAKKKLEAEETLREHERVRQLFVEHSPAAIAMFDRDMKYIVASRRFLMDYNLGDQNVIGRSHYEVFPEISERWREIHRHCLAGAVEKSDAEPFPRADGKTDWVRWEIRPWFESRGQIGGIILFSEVITQRKQSEEEIKTINEELIAINRIIADITGVSRINEILEKVLDDSLDITGLEGGTICMVTPENTLQLAAHRNTSEATILDLTTNEIKIGDCLCGQCARDHKPLILSDLEAVLKYAPREETRGEDIRFHAAFPMIMAGRCLGVLCVFTRTDKKPEKRRLKILETVSSQIALAIQNARLFEASMHNAAMLEERVKERTAELEKKITEIKRLNRIFVDRELRMKELKEKIWELEKAFTSKKT